jgi:hypothetical protein
MTKHIRSDIGAQRATPTWAGLETPAQRFVASAACRHAMRACLVAPTWKLAGLVLTFANRRRT